MSTAKIRGIRGSLAALNYFAAASRPRLLRLAAKQAVELAAEAQDGDREEVLKLFDDLLARKDLPDDVRGMLKRARDRFAGGGDDGKGDGDEKGRDAAVVARKAARAILIAQRPDLDPGVRAYLSTKKLEFVASYLEATAKGTKGSTMAKHNEGGGQSARKAELDAKMGMTPKTPDIRIENGAVVFGIISKADGRILLAMTPTERRELARATGAAKVRIWEAAKKAKAA